MQVQTFERLVERVLYGLLGTKCMSYIDDIICMGTSFVHAASNLQSVLDRIRSAGLTLKPKKCVLFKREVTFFRTCSFRSGS